MPAVEDVELLWGAITFVSLKYTLQKDSEKKKRPMQCYESGDGQRVWNAILEISNEYGVYKHYEGTGGPKADFQKIKGRVLQQLIEGGLTTLKRNFYSSVVSTYFSWQYHGTPEKRAEVLEIIRSLPPLPNRHKF